MTNVTNLIDRPSAPVTTDINLDDPAARSRRRVCNLTPWEVQRKRAIDRANQQHWRKKKRLYIADLEAQVARLTARLEEAEAKLKRYEQTEETEREVARPPTVTAVASPTSPTSPSASGPSPSRSSTSSSQPIVPTTQAQPQPQPGNNVQLDLFDPAPSSSLSLALPIFDSSLGDIEMNGDADADVDVEASVSHVVDKVLQPVMRQQQQQQQRRRQAPQTSPSPLATHVPYIPYYLGGRHHAQSQTYSLPDWMDLPLNLPVATELDKLVLITSQALVQRYSTREFSQPVFPSVEGLMSCIQTDARRSSVEADAQVGGVVDNSHPVLAAVACHVVWISPLKHLTSRLAFLYKLALFLRWCLCPSPATYNAMPHFLRPTLLQRRVPHPVWIDMIVWPEVRDRMIRAGDFGRFELFRSVTGQSMTVNWPYTDSGTFVELDLGVEGTRQALNPIFEAHIRNPDNYSVGREAALVFPVLNEYVREGRAS
ncbi:hypothetical protein Sste5346_009606 [Sporothrix stenoceras]|uniref:BZIP domain-containing protein n=1 Tax=Sporothrix stenoceras TaxID=5173 RepID=A0ABR3YJA6_9PEZI